MAAFLDRFAGFQSGLWGGRRHLRGTFFHEDGILTKWKKKYCRRCWPPFPPPEPMRHYSSVRRSWSGGGAFSAFLTQTRKIFQHFDQVSVHSKRSVQLKCFFLPINFYFCPICVFIFSKFIFPFEMFLKSNGGFPRPYFYCKWVFGAFPASENNGH